ncbi:MAG: hypothetical protein AB7Q97_01885 [Gammaproteobacteria bacterium]
MDPVLEIKSDLARSRILPIRVLATDRIGQDAMRGLDLIQRVVAEARQARVEKFLGENPKGEEVPKGSKVAFVPFGTARPEVRRPHFSPDMSPTPKPQEGRACS